MERNNRYRLLLGLLVGALVLSVLLNFYFLKQQNDQFLQYELEASLPPSFTELELARARAQLAQCRGRGHVQPDSLARLSRIPIHLEH